MSTTLKSRAPAIMRLIGCFDALPDEPLARILSISLGLPPISDLSDQELVDRVERYVAHRKGAADEK